MHFTPLRYGSSNVHSSILLPFDRQRRVALDAHLCCCFYGHHQANHFPLRNDASCWVLASENPLGSLEKRGRIEWILEHLGSRFLFLFCGLFHRCWWLGRNLRLFVWETINCRHQVVGRHVRWIFYRFGHFGNSLDVFGKRKRRGGCLRMLQDERAIFRVRTL